jgi:sodium/potassium-transporting ATPase subunit alpha
MISSLCKSIQLRCVIRECSSNSAPRLFMFMLILVLLVLPGRMAKKNVLVKKLEAVETLGSTTIICSDKTGTLTMNRMTLVHVGIDRAIQTAKTATQTSTIDEDNLTFKNLFFLAANCAKAKFDDTEMTDEPNLAIDDRKVNGDASEAGILKWAEKVTPVAAFRKANPQVSTIPFNSSLKYMVTINKDSMAPPESCSVLRLCMKGAPERVLDRCTKIMINGVVRDITNDDRAAIDDNLSFLMSNGERVLGFAQLSLPEADFPVDFEFDTEAVNFPMEGLTFVGLMALMDPPRESVPDAVATCLSAGVKVAMVTGDHPTTALSIAKQVGIVRDPTREEIARARGVPIEDVDPSEAKAIVVPGSLIKDLEESDWDSILAHEQIVFARTSPQQKLLIVENNQRIGHIVAVTGDGVNDSPALKKANIGIAMGISGSDVSKEASDMVLLDDNFASIVNGVEEGRLIFDNLKKSIACMCSEDFCNSLLDNVGLGVVGLN